ncbi:hypothetical protein V492_06301 [Pseudogymnoascus sp. VKM F-4246]|nr:hypothetical protein V492_06301 [Pseudogymnoascus sp. VKM F-4246]
MSSKAEITSYYTYDPSHALPAVFAALVGISFLVHIWQNFRYHYWRVTFFMFYGGAVFTSGWILRIASSYDPGNIKLYIAQTCLILGGPPIYSAAEYNVLGRLMHYTPMHSPINPSRVLYFFIYVGAAVESLTAVGAVRLSAAEGDLDKLKNGETFISIALVLQGVVECLFMSMVALIHYRCARAKMVTPNVHTICIMLYGTSSLVLLRCIFRAVESFSTLSVISSGTCDGTCKAVLRHEWYIYAFEAAPMVLYTYWLNIVHPGRFLPHNTKVYLDYNGVERVGPGWQDKRSTWMTFVDPFDIRGKMSGNPDHEQYWLNPEEYPPVAVGATKQESNSESVRALPLGESSGEGTELGEFDGGRLTAMPGVPSGRGCDGCRAQKKKCDQAKPSCSRCARLKIACVGAGQQRFKFKEEQGTRNTVAIAHRAKGFKSFNIIDVAKTVPHTPSNPLTMATNEFVSTMTVSTGVRFNLTYWYGEFLQDIPKRLGRNKALDTAVMALTASHSSFCLRQRATPETLMKYSVALRTLRFYLDDTAKACSSETLCAVMLLLICQGFLGISDIGWTGHCEGAALILKARRYYDPKDDFESKLHLSLRAPVIFEGLFNPNIQFTPLEWKTLVDNHIDEGTFPGRMMRYVSQVTCMIRHGNFFNGERGDEKSIDELRNNYQALKASLKRYETYMESLIPDDKVIKEVAFDAQTYYLIQRFFTFGLTVATILGCVLGALDTEDSEIPSDLNSYATGIMAFTEAGKRFKPLGASYMQLCFQAAWIGTTDPAVKAEAEKEMCEYVDDFGGAYTRERLMAELERMSRHVRLIEPYTS